MFHPRSQGVKWVCIRSSPGYTWLRKSVTQPSPGPPSVLWLEILYSRKIFVFWQLFGHRDFFRELDISTKSQLYFFFFKKIFRWENIESKSYQNYFDQRLGNKGAIWLIF